MKKKITAICLVVALAATAIVGGTLAYFTDTTDEVRNEFTVGNVAIDLDEPNWEYEGDKANLVPGTQIAKDPTITVLDKSQDAYVFLKLDMNKYVSLINLMGVDAYKNNIAGLEGTYPGFGEFMNTLATDREVRETVVNRWFTGINHNDWEIMNLDEIQAAVEGTATETNPKAISVVLGYKGGDNGGIVSEGDEIKFMDSFGMPETVTSSMFDGEDAYYIDGVSKSNFNTEKASFKMTFTAYAIQAEGIDGLAAAYSALQAEMAD